MSKTDKLFSAREAAEAVLKKAKQILEDSSLTKSEKLKKDQTLGQAIGYPGSGSSTPPPPPPPTMGKAEYKTENDPKPGVKYGKIEKDQKPIERDYKNFEVQKESPNSSGDDKRQEKQVSPSGNPKEEAEGNNKPDGMEPEFEFKDKVAKELAKEKASHMVKSQSGMHTVMYQTAPIQKSETEANDLSKAEKNKSFIPNKISGGKELDTYIGQKGVRTPDSSRKVSALGATGLKNPERMASEKASAKANLGDIKEMSSKNRSGMGKNENSDKDADADLGEKVEHDVEEHHKDMGNEVDEEGHDAMAKPEDKAEGQTERASIPMCIGSAKLSKFMEYKHSKRKNAQAQGQEAVGQSAQDAPAASSTQAGQPDNSRPKSQPTDGDVNKSESNFDKLKHKIENKEGYSEKGAAGAAYEAGKAKYGKAGMAAKAAAGRKK